MQRREWTQWTRRQITNWGICLTKLSVLFPGVENQWRCCCFTDTRRLRLKMKSMIYECQCKSASDSFLMPVDIAVQKAGDGSWIKAFTLIHFLGWFDFSGRLLPDDTEGDESITLRCSASNAFYRMERAEGLTPDLRVRTCERMKFWSRICEDGALKRSRGRLAKHFCGHSLTSREGFPDWVMQDISHQDVIHLLRLFHSPASHS